MNVVTLNYLTHLYPLQRASASDLYRGLLLFKFKPYNQLQETVFAYPWSACE